MSNPSNKTKHVLVIPFPAQGHLIPLLDLSHHLSITHNYSLSILITPQNLRLIQSFLSSTPLATPLILPLPSHHSIPSNVEHSRLLPYHIHSILLSLPLSQLQPDILSWAESNPNPVSLIISDNFLGWTTHLAEKLKVPRICFSSCGAFGASVIDYAWINTPKPKNGDENELICLSTLPSSPSFPFSQLPSVYRNYIYKPGNPDLEFVKDTFLANFSSWGVIINTFHALETEYIEHFKKLYGHERVWAVGPIKPTGSPTSRGGKTSISSNQLTSWLATCPPKSVVYICFGSQYTPSEPQAEALASSLELSKVPFIWALGGSTMVIPNGFEERTKERGLVVRGWAPQVEILGHVAVGGFLTHCGWNSVLESVVSGVALLTWPMKADQFVNMKLVLQKGIGLKVAEGMEAVPEVENLAKVLKDSVEEKKCAELREKAVEMGQEAAQAVEKGGSSYNDLLEMVKEMDLVALKTDI